MTVNDASAQQPAIEVIYRSHDTTPYRITQHIDNVYWLNGIGNGRVIDPASHKFGPYEILAASKTTGTVRVVGTSASIDLVLLESGGYIYKLDRSTIHRYKSSGGDEELVFEKPNYFEPVMAVSPSGLVYWLTQPESGGLLQSMSIRDRRVTTLTFGEKTTNGGRAIADDNNVYWIETTGILKAVSAQTGQLRQLSRNCRDIEALAADETHVYFISTLQGIMRVSKAAPLKIDRIGGPSGSYEISDLAVDDYFVYYISRDRIEKLSKAGGSVQNVATGLKLGSLLVDRDYVYFTEQGPDGNRLIARIAKTTR